MHFRVLINQAQIGEAEGAEDAAKVFVEYAEDRYRWLYNDGRSATAIRVACLDRLARELGAAGLQGVFELEDARSDDGTPMKAWNLIR